MTKVDRIIREHYQALLPADRAEVRAYAAKLAAALADPAAPMPPSVPLSPALLCAVLHSLNETITPRRTHQPIAHRSQYRVVL